MAARRAGLSLEEWVAALTNRKPATSSRQQAGDIDAIIARMGQTVSGRATLDENRARVEAEDRDARTAVALESMAVWMEQAEDRLNEAARSSADHQDRLATVLAQAFSTLKDRLDTVERQIVTARAPAPPTRIEFPIQDAVRALAPLSDTLTGLRSDMGRLTERLEKPLDISPSPAIETIRSDLERLQMSVGSLASRDEIATLEGSIRHLVGSLVEGRNSQDMLALANVVADLERQIQHMTENLSDKVHSRISSEIETLSRRIDKAAEAGIDRSVIEFLSSQIIDMRQDLAQRAEPRQLEKLSNDMAALGHQVTELRLNQVGRHDFAALKASLEDICSALNRTAAAQATSDVPDRLDSLSERVDLLVNRPEPEPINLTPVARQLALLTERMSEANDNRTRHSEALMTLIERLSADVQSVTERPALSHAPLLDRFDQLKSELRQVGQQADISGVEGMLLSISEKLDRAPAPALDALEERLAALTEQLAKSRSEAAAPVIAEPQGIERLQEEAALIAERAAKAALKDMPAGVTESDLDALKQGFVELKALHSRADKKTQQTLRAVHDALETLIGRGIPQAATVEAYAPGEKQDDMPSADRLEAAVRRLHAAALSQIEEVAATSPFTGSPTPDAKDTDVTDREQGSEETRDLNTAVFSSRTDLEDMRSGFIAAARRAAQKETVQASEPAPGALAENALAGHLDSDALDIETVGKAPSPGLIRRLRQVLNNHKRPLVFGLALLVLATGSLRIASAIFDQEIDKVALAEKIVTAEISQQDPVTKESAGAGFVQPVSFTAGPAVPSTSAFFINPATIGDIPTRIPAMLREAVLAGDATAVYELATRSAEGRGLDQDSALAVHLFERAAQAGLVPAQERLAMAYEKGFGVTRDMKLAATWYERAALGGNTRAMHNLATLLAAGIGGKPDYVAALPWYVEAAEAGLKDSQFNLAVMYTRGAGTRQDLTKAYRWFALAANQGDADAAKKRDEVSIKLSAGDLAIAKALVERWRPRAVDSQANDVKPSIEGRTAALDPHVAGRT